MGEEGSRFFVGSEVAVFQEAVTLCGAQQASLARISSLEEESAVQFLIPEFNSSAGFWIGIKVGTVSNATSLEDLEFQFIDGYQDVSFVFSSEAPWDLSFPLDVEESGSCVKLVDEIWTLDNCGTAKLFICREDEAGTQSETPTNSPSYSPSTLPTGAPSITNGQVLTRAPSATSKEGNDVLLYSVLAAVGLVSFIALTSLIIVLMKKSSTQKRRRSSEREVMLAKLNHDKQVIDSSKNPLYESSMSIPVTAKDDDENSFYGQSMEGML